MKSILLTLVLVACASPQHGKLAPGEGPRQGTSFNEIKEMKENPPTSVTNLSTGSYIHWDNEVMVFKNDIYQHTLKTPEGGDKYKLAMETSKIKEAPEKTIYLKQWNKEVNPAQWKEITPLLSSILKERGFTVVEKPEDAQQMLRVSFGVLEMTGGHYRYLNFNSINSRSYLSNKEESSYWKAKVSSWGTGKNLSPLVPVMLFALNDFLKKPESGVSSPTVDERSSEYLIYRDYFGIQ